MTLVGAPSFSTVKAASITWQPMSPIAPAPKSCHARQANGWYQGCTGASAPGRSTDPSPGPRARQASRSAAGTLRPYRAVGPTVHVANRTNRARSHPLLHQAQAFFRVALVAHLRHDLVFPCRLGQRPRLADGARQRLLHVDVLPELHRRHRDDGVIVIGRGDDDRVDVFLLLEHLAEVLVQHRLRELLGDAVLRHRRLRRVAVVESQSATMLSLLATFIRFDVPMPWANPTTATFTVSLGAWKPAPSTWRGTIVIPAAAAAVPMNVRRDTDEGAASRCSFVCSPAL